MIIILISDSETSLNMIDKLNQLTSDEAERKVRLEKTANSGILLRIHELLAKRKASGERTIFIHTHSHVQDKIKNAAGNHKKIEKIQKNREDSVETE